ncbi:MAG TPA: glycosyltransferase family 1 protein [Ramlibacter sp.]|jgi:glycosyltransferase involved in cell wall biosynthesis|uniref:glycosyltransferase family 4 protein n=1 Tax=Ramlibacter sp. TaxID=1917967 RepID=UPI002D3E8126|nr:glycosyltransferase family 1 protein [Ramlibacter sp.]HZY18217.1 glycosyltransferase family 1 protein [Ramlibacter sp.]
MKIALVTDAWLPQVNGVVTTLIELVRELGEAGHEVLVIEPGQFRTRPCPGYPGIELAVSPGRQLAARLDAWAPDAVHLATEGPLGWAGRRHCLRAGLAFTTAFHTKFPEIVHAATRIPVGWGYALMRHFHRPSSGVMVPTEGVLQMLQRRGLRNLRAWTHGVDTDLFRFAAEPGEFAALGRLPRPVWLFVGRVSYEKNIGAFLATALPGTKVVCGVGPVEAALKARHPEVRWVGLLPRPELATLYAAADVFVFPSRADTFGLVMVEAMATGAPVAAFPVDGPLEVLGRSHPDGSRPMGGVLDEDLQQAALRALGVPRTEARERAEDFSWKEAARLFAGFLVPARTGQAVPRDAAQSVTTLSSGQ